jgi:hypothetical protein
MKTPNRPARLNRAVLGIIGALLLAAGAFELTAGYGMIRQVPGDQALSFLGDRPQHWVRYAALAAAVLLGLAALRWLAAQTARRPRTSLWRLTAGPGRGVTAMHADTAAAPLAADVESYEGVRSAAAWLAGPRHSPVLYLRVRTEYDTDLSALRRRIHEHAVPRLRGALELKDLPAAIHLVPVAGRTRVR